MILRRATSHFFVQVLWIRGKHVWIHFRKSGFVLEHGGWQAQVMIVNKSGTWPKFTKACGGPTLFSVKPTWRRSRDVDVTLHAMVSPLIQRIWLVSAMIFLDSVGGSCRCNMFQPFFSFWNHLSSVQNGGWWSIVFFFQWFFVYCGILRLWSKYRQLEYDSNTLLTMKIFIRGIPMNHRGVSWPKPGRWRFWPSIIPGVIS